MNIIKRKDGKTLAIAGKGKAHTCACNSVTHISGFCIFDDSTRPFCSNFITTVEDLFPPLNVSLQRNRNVVSILENDF